MKDQSKLDFWLSAFHGFMNVIHSQYLLILVVRVAMQKGWKSMALYLL